MMHRTPYVGTGAQGARRSAQIDLEEAECLDPGDPRRDELLASAARWEEQADQERETIVQPTPSGAGSALRAAHSLLELCMGTSDTVSRDAVRSLVLDVIEALTPDEPSESSTPGPDPAPVRFCGLCLAHVPVVDEFDDQVGYEEKAREVRVTALDCGHEIVIPAAALVNP